ncbi:MAG TPA: hypothetical protein VJU61_05350, partial [Polyangiaceae bacterium]|nr:hypothetical protein [Polyangiaceae bacterium]
QLPERGVPAIDEQRALKLSLPCEGRALEIYGDAPENLDLRSGRSSELILFASRGVALEGLAVVPLADELPPPPPKPWSPEAPGG